MFINKAKELLNNTNARNFYAVGVQDFEFTEKYDVIWVQWVLTQLSHEDAITFLRKAK